MTVRVAPAGKPGTRSLLAAALLALASGGAAAQSPVEDLDQRLRILERKLELKDEEAAAKAKDAAVTTIGDKGFAWKSAGGDVELQFRGVAQLDWRSYLDDESPRFADGFTLRRLRPSFEGALGKLVAFRLTPEFAGSNATLVDAYVDLRFHPAATLRAGKLKGPVGLERLQSGSAIRFVERGLPTELAPNRDIGVQLQGELAGGRLGYVAGVYNGTADGRDAAAGDVDSRKEVGLRLFAEPFKASPGVFQNLGFGIGASHGSKYGMAAGTGGVLPQYRSPGQNTFFQYAAGVAADGTHTRLSPQLSWSRDALGLLGEYIRSTQDLKLAAVEGEVDNSAWQLAATWVLTGEDASFRGVRPRRPWTAGGEGWGALEIGARYGELAIDDAAFTRGFAAPGATAQADARAFGAVLNWYATAHARVVLDYTQTSFNAFAGADREDEKALFSRLQLAF